MPALTTYNFEVTLADERVATEELAGALFAAGCDDASVSSCNGVVTVEFDREAPTLRDALDSAAADIEQAGYRVRTTKTGVSRTVVGKPATTMTVNIQAAPAAQAALAEEYRPRTCEVLADVQDVDDWGDV
jgi:hypothetical protein